MAAERIRINVVPMNSETAQTDRIIPVSTIGASEIESYVAEGYGPGVPKSERAHRISRELLDSMTALSTDEEYDILAQLDQAAWLPHWLELAGPVVESARRAGSYVDQEFTTRENNAFAARQPIDEDLQYMFSLFNLSSFVVAAELGLKHPNDAPDDLVAGDTSKEANRQTRHDLLQSVSESRLVPGPYRRKARRIRRQGEKVVGDSVASMPRLVEVLKRAHEAEA